jgi:hypothetical protein
MNTIYSVNAAHFTHSSYSMEVTNSSNSPQTPRPSHTTRDQRLQAQTLHDIGIPYSRISEPNTTLRQVRYAINHRIPPKKLSGRPLILKQEEMCYIIT